MGWVTPCVGVWIETGKYAYYDRVSQSHPAWVCGLKHQFCACKVNFHRHTLRGCVDWNKGRMVNSPGGGVTPCVGVWIETRKELLYLHPTWVTPCVGVWIETYLWWNKKRKAYVTPCVGVWIETFLGSSASSTSCHTLRGCVDWNGKQLNQHLILHCHTLRGCVDWNFTLCNLYYWPRVTPCVGVWIETYSEHIANVQKGHTLRGCVDWNWEACAGYIMDVVTPCVGVWIETMTRWIRV